MLLGRLAITVLLGAHQNFQPIQIRIVYLDPFLSPHPFFPCQTSSRKAKELAKMHLEIIPDLKLRIISKKIKNKLKKNE